MSILIVLFEHAIKKITKISHNCSIFTLFLTFQKLLNLLNNCSKSPDFHISKVKKISTRPTPIAIFRSYHPSPLPNPHVYSCTFHLFSAYPHTCISAYPHTCIPAYLSHWYPTHLREYVIYFF